jgi:sugar O-acyltransferase (sialic acid O-acetyltransferase NeuD family)
VSGLRLVVIGAAGFGREVLDVVDAMVQAGSRPRLQLVGVVDDRPSDLNLSRLARRGVTHLGTVAQWLESKDGCQFVVGIGQPAIRQGVAELCRRRGREAATLIHPTATLGSSVCCGPGVVICAGVQISNEVQVGTHTHLNPNATIGHDSVLGDFVSINPGAIVSGDCQIEAGSLIGAGAVVLQQRRVGAGAVVGAAACVTRDVSPGTTVMGVPAR